MRHRALYASMLLSLIIDPQQRKEKLGRFSEDPARFTENFQSLTFAFLPQIPETGDLRLRLSQTRSPTGIVIQQERPETGIT